MVHYDLHHYNHALLSIQPSILHWIHTHRGKHTVLFWFPDELIEEGLWSCHFWQVPQIPQNRCPCSILCQFYCFSTVGKFPLGILMCVLWIVPLELATFQTIKARNRFPEWIGGMVNIYLLPRQCEDSNRCVCKDNDTWGPLNLIHPQKRTELPFQWETALLIPPGKVTFPVPDRVISYNSIRRLYNLIYLPQSG